jgi:hypothetical protein
MSRRREPAKMRTVKRVEMVRALVIKLFPLKYFLRLYQGDPSSFLAR